MMCRMIRCLAFACLVTMGSTGEVAVAGSIAAWGDDTHGQVSNTPTGTGFMAIAGGYSHGYALRGDGSIAAWGSDWAGEVSNTPAGTGFTAIAGGTANGYALRADGSIAAWGWDGNGQVLNTPSGTGFTAIAGGGDAIGCALRADGSIAAWGDYYGPAQIVPGGTGFTAIAVGFSNVYALRSGQPPAVPEPSSVVLTALGAIAVVWRHYRRRTA